jgi:hypothetical protein
MHGPIIFIIYYMCNPCFKRYSLDTRLGCPENLKSAGG